MTKDKWLQTEAGKYEKIITSWALERKLIEKDQEVKIRMRVRRKPIPRRWQLTDEEWATILSLLWSDYKRYILEKIRRRRGKSIALDEFKVPSMLKWGIGRDEKPSETVFYSMNKAFTVANLPYRISMPYGRTPYRRRVRIGVLQQS